MANNQTTPLSQLLGKPEQSHQQMVPAQDPSAQYGNLPRMGAGPVDTKMITQMMPSGVGQGLSMPEGSNRKEFFGFDKFNWKAVITVFAIILVGCGLFPYCVKPYVPGATGSDGKISNIGSLVAAIVGALLFAIIQFFGKF